MIGEKFNYDETFLRDLTLTLLDTLEGRVKWVNKFTSGDVEVSVPFYYSLSGDERFVNMKNGDAVIYKGCEREHWRYPLESKYNKIERMFKKDDTYHHQIFFHYVNANGPYLPFAFDRTL